MSTDTESTRSESGWLIGIPATFAFGLGALCWLAARATLAVTDATAAGAPFARAPLFAIRLVSSGDPAQAWHRTYPQAAPLATAPFWVAASLLACLLIGATAYVLSRSSGASTPGTSRTSGANLPANSPARWASRRVEKQLVVPRDPSKRPWRLTAGRGLASKRLLAGRDCVSAVAFGPNGSGKTTSLIIPNVIDWHGPVVMTTAKVQDLPPIVAARSVRGPVWIIAPGGAPGCDTVGWSPLLAASDDDAADRVAEWMVESSAMAADPKARPWNAQARKYLKGLLLAAHASNASLDGWISWIHAGERAKDEVDDILQSAGHTAAAREYASTWQIHEEGKGSVLFTALGLADTYSRPGVARAADIGGFTPRDLFDQAGTVCIVTPNSEGERHAPYFTTLISAILAEAERRGAEQGGPLTPRLLLALDEAGNVFHHPRLPHLLTTARGNGIQLMLIYHDLAQIEHLYGGRQVARTVISNAKMRLLLPGVGDLDTLRYFSDLLGHTRTQTHGITTGFDGKRSRSANEHDDHLAPLHQLQQLPDGQAILLYENLPPAKIRLLPWYTDRRYRHLRDAP